MSDDLTMRCARYFGCEDIPRSVVRTGRYSAVMVARGYLYFYEEYPAFQGRRRDPEGHLARLTEEMRKDLVRSLGEWPT